MSRRPTMDSKVRDEVSIAIDIRDVVKVFGAACNEAAQKLVDRVWTRVLQ